MTLPTPEQGTAGGQGAVDLIECAACHDPVRIDDAYTLLPPWEEVVEVCRPACMLVVQQRWAARAAREAGGS